MRQNQLSSRRKGQKKAPPMVVERRNLSGRFYLYVFICSLSLSGSLIDKAFIVVNTILSKRSECSLRNQIYITSQEIF